MVEDMDQVEDIDKHAEEFARLSEEEYDNKISDIVSDTKRLREIFLTENNLFEFMLICPETRPFLSLTVDLFSALQEDKIWPIKVTESGAPVFIESNTKTILGLLQSGGRLKDWEQYEKMDAIDACNALNDFYLNGYEGLTNTILKDMAHGIIENNRKKNIDKKNRDVHNEIKRNADVIRALEKYRGGKFSQLFAPLKPVIRNAVAHSSNWFWDMKKRKIMFSKNDKCVLSLTLKEYWEICESLVWLINAIECNLFKACEPWLKATL